MRDNYQETTLHEFANFFKKIFLDKPKISWYSFKRGQ